MRRLQKKSYVFHRRLNYDYPVITHGRGIYLYDNNGKKYIDGSGGPAVVNIGHGVKEIARRAQQLISKFSYLYSSQFTTQHMEDYAKELCLLAPKGMDKVFFVSGGAEAIESAVKLAGQYHYDSGKPSKYKVISRYPAYHGDTILTLSLSTKPDMRKPHLSILLHFPKIPAPYCYRCPFGKTYPNCSLPCAWVLEKAIKKAGQGQVSAFIAETIIGSTAAAVIPPKEYFPIIRKICDKYGVLLILDEVKVGFGRTGKWFACQHWNFTPDIVVMGKGISGGIAPLAAVFCQDKIFKAIKKGTGSFMHSFTFMNNQFTTGIGREVLKYLKDRDLVRQSAVKGKYLLSELSALKELKMVGDVRGLGLMVGIEFVENKKTKKPFPRKLHIAEKIVQAALRRGLSILFGVGYTEDGQGDALMITPPFIATKAELGKIVKIIKESILEVQKSL